MRDGLYGLLTAALLALPVAAQETPIQHTIQSQIEPSRRMISPRAFTLPAPNIKGIFGTAENFGAMVKKGYPMV